MTVNEALVKIKGILEEATENENSVCYVTDCDKEPLEMAIKSLEKQRPKIPYFSGDGYWNGQIVYDTWTCPNCSKSYEVDYEEYDYCPNCGQAIKWKNS